MSKIKEKKLSSIKSEMDEIKKFIVSNNDLDNSKQNETNYFNNNSDDTLTLTKIVQNKKYSNNINDLSEMKKDLVELKNAVEINKNLLNEILLRIK